MSADAEFRYSDLLPTGRDETPYRLLSTEGVSTFEVDGRTFLQVDPAALRLLTAEAMHDIAHFLRPAHLAQLRRIIDDPEASGNDRFVALDLLKNVNISAGGVLPMCQDTGTAIVMGKKSEGVLTGADDGEWISKGVYDAYTKLNLRYSQLAPLTMWEEKNTGTNLPAQIELYSTPGSSDAKPEYKFLFMAKGGGSANKSFLFQETKAVLNPKRMLEFLDEKIRSLGTAACPPYHLAVVIGGTSAEFALKTAKYASAHYLDNLPTVGLAWTRTGSATSSSRTRSSSSPSRSGSARSSAGSTSATTSAWSGSPGTAPPARSRSRCPARPTGRRSARSPPTGIFLEELDRDPAKYMPETTDSHLESGDVVKIDLNRPMAEILAELSKHPVKTRLSLTGPLVVARDIAHAKIQELLDDGGEMPQYLKDHAVYYAGPAKTPAGYASGSFGPTTAGRMDSYVEAFQAAGGSMVMLAKGNRSAKVTNACKEHGGFYLGSIGGPAARLAQDCIKHVEVLEYPELGMEAVWKIDVEDFPAFIVVDDKGNDFFAETAKPVALTIRTRSAEKV